MPINRFSEMARNMGAVIEEEENTIPFPIQVNKVETELKTSKKQENEGNNSVLEEKLFAKKTLKLPLLFDLAIKEIKDRRNIRKQLRKEKGRFSEDDIVVEALDLYFKQKGTHAASLESAKDKLKKYQ